MNHIACFDFSGIYEDFPNRLRAEGSPHFCYINCYDIKGTHGYCDVSAQEALRARMRTYGVTPAGVHFLDNGNYHYLSYLFLREIDAPFTLILIDHHPDLRAPLFSADGAEETSAGTNHNNCILSCGGWDCGFCRYC